MQDNSDKIAKFKMAIGEVFSNLRITNGDISLNKLALEYEIDKGSLSKLERGVYDCRLSTAWKLAQANGIKFSDFAKLLEEKLGKDFTFIDL
ncbi:MAG: helix-turn-helix transcriptional regulator [Cyanobacteria bacterium SIG27]|nr:helix-turn-helix transcriptional regulator [Cyanobacteria bacterium SIG27]MBQ9150417.1 helix-turn-helix transcriptional regulator [bacterium]